MCARNGPFPGVPRPWCAGIWLPWRSFRAVSGRPLAGVRPEMPFPGDPRPWFARIWPLFGAPLSCRRHVGLTSGSACWLGLAVPGRSLPPRGFRCKLFSYTWRAALFFTFVLRVSDGLCSTCRVVCVLWGLNLLCCFWRCLSAYIHIFTCYLSYIH